jgi:diguanylate cyclase (GGDEF)-like protein
LLVVGAGTLAGLAAATAFDFPPDAMAIARATGTGALASIAACGVAVSMRNRALGRFASSVRDATISGDWSHVPRPDPQLGTHLQTIATAFESLHSRAAEREELISHYQAHTIEQAAQLIEQINERDKNAERVRHLAYFDGLTGLPNKMLFADRLACAVANARRQASKLAVIAIGIDRFKQVNETLGYGAGDRLLEIVAERLQRCVREEDTVARHGSDEFLILLPRLHEVDDAEVVARKLIEAVTPPANVEDSDIHITASAGISAFPDDAFEGETLIQHSCVALQRAKKLGGARHEYYQPGAALAIPSLNVASNLRRALDRQEFTLLFQPIVNLRTGQPVAAEALLRWEHPQLGTLPPSCFINIAEETGLIVPLTAWTIEQASRQMAAWREMGHDLQRVAVNISVRSLRDANFARSVRSAVETSRIRPDLLELEVTESVLIDDFDLTLSALREVTDDGVQIAIDDFGTGYSSLSYLQKIPLHALKIDRSFIHNVSGTASGGAIVDLVIAVGHRLGLRVVAEGVETNDQMRFVHAQGCDEAQGFLIAQPMSAAAMDRFLSSGYAAMEMTQ